jgi:hypothetical protein
LQRGDKTTFITFHPGRLVVGMMDRLSEREKIDDIKNALSIWNQATLMVKL